MRIRCVIFLATLVLCLVPLQFSRPVSATATPTANTVYLFVEVEAKVHRKDSPDQQ
jgi:hypothetical protein